MAAGIDARQLDRARASASARSVHRANACSSGACSDHSVVSSWSAERAPRELLAERREPQPREPHAGEHRRHRRARRVLAWPVQLVEPQRRRQPQRVARGSRRSARPRRAGDRRNASSRVAHSRSRAAASAWAAQPAARSPAAANMAAAIARSVSTNAALGAASRAGSAVPTTAGSDDARDLGGDSACVTPSSADAQRTDHAVVVDDRRSRRSGTRG